MKTIKELRFMTGLTQAAFGQKYNIPVRSIQNWEAGVRECPIYVVELLERVVNMDLCYVVKFTEDGITRYISSNGTGYGNLENAHRFISYEDAESFAIDLIEEYKEQSWNKDFEYSYEVVKL